jgi:hypothetical protein
VCSAREVGVWAIPPPLGTQTSYCFFVTPHLWSFSTHTPPAFSHSALFLASFSPAKAGAVKDMARPIATIIDTILFMGFSYVECPDSRTNKKRQQVIVGSTERVKLKPAPFSPFPFKWARPKAAPARDQIFRTRLLGPEFSISLRALKFTSEKSNDQIARRRRGLSLRYSCASTPRRASSSSGRMVTEVRLACGPGRTRVHGVCVARTTIRHTRRVVRRCARWHGGVCVRYY